MHNFEDLEFHLFSDTNTKVDGTVAYLCASSNKGITTAFVVSENRETPLKTLTLSRLELMGALLSARLCNKIWKALKLKIHYHFWTDSKIAYFWIMQYLTNSSYS